MGSQHVCGAERMSLRVRTGLGVRVRHNCRLLCSEDTAVRLRD